MKLAASQIGWSAPDEAQALEILAGYGFSGLEVAPTRVAGPEPYDKPAEAAVYAGAVLQNHGLQVCSMQSIWYGQAGSMFGAGRDFLLGYTMAAIRFAKVMGAGNLVFGCPKNRSLPEGAREEDAIPFFKTLGDAAAAQGTCLALEANAAAYGTNFMNHTADALAMAKRVDSAGCKVNFDYGTLLLNGEDPQALRGHVAGLNHVHISEPYLAMLEEREGHRTLAAVLREEGYTGYVSIEMKEQPLENLKKAARWVAEVFG